MQPAIPSAWCCCRNRAFRKSGWWPCFPFSLGCQLLQRNAGERTGRVQRHAALVEDRALDRADRGTLRVLEIAGAFVALLRIDQEMRLRLVDRLARAQRYARPAIGAEFDDFQCHDDVLSVKPKSATEITEHTERTAVFLCDLCVLCG